MPFSGPFREPFSAPIFSPGGVVPWYLLGGVTAAQCVAAYLFKGAASAAIAKVNLNTPGTHDITDGTAVPSWTSGTGFTFLAASSQFLKTDIVAASNQTWSMIVRFTNAADSTNTLGAQSGGNTRFRLDASVASKVQYSDGGTLAVSPGLVNGVLAVAGNIGYRNGTADAGTIGAFGGTLSHPVYIGCVNSSGTPFTFFSGDIQAVAIYNIVLSSTQVGLITAAMAAL